MKGIKKNYKNKIKIFFCLIICIITNFLLSKTVNAESREVPISKQLQVLQGLLSIENNFRNNDSPIITACVIFQSNYSASAQTKNDIFSYAKYEKVMIANSTVRFIPIDAAQCTKNIYDCLEDYQCDIFLVAPMANYRDYKDILRYSNDNSILTVGTNFSLMKNIFSISIVYRENSVVPMLNQQNVQAEGFNFPTQIFKFLQTTKEK